MASAEANNGGQSGGGRGEGNLDRIAIFVIDRAIYLSLLSLGEDSVYGIRYTVPFVARSPYCRYPSSPSHHRKEDKEKKRKNEIVLFIKNYGVILP